MIAQDYVDRIFAKYSSSSSKRGWRLVLKLIIMAVARIGLVPLLDLTEKVSALLFRTLPDILPSSHFAQPETTICQIAIQIWRYLFLNKHFWIIFWWYDVTTYHYEMLRQMTINPLEFCQVILFCQWQPFAQVDLMHYSKFLSQTQQRKYEK